MTVHVLPTGEVDPPRYADLSALRYRDFSRVQGRIEQAHEATAGLPARARARRTG